MFIVLEPFGHFVVSKVSVKVVSKISNDPKQRKSVTIKPSHKTLLAIFSQTTMAILV